MPIESSVNVLKRLKQNEYKVYYLSNFHLAAFEHVTHKYEFFQNFNGGVVSYKVRILKPEKEIYEMIINRYHLEANETLFIDDMKENVNAAVKSGLKGIILKDPKDLKEELEVFNINI